MKLKWSEEFRHYSGSSIFGSHQEETSMDDYGRMLARLICFLLRSYASRDFKWTIQHPYWNSTSSKLRALDGLCSARPVNKLSIRASIHELLSELFSWRDERIVEEVKCPIYRFVIAALVNTSATGFLTAKGVTPIISKLQYCIRANVYQQIMDRDNIIRSRLEPPTDGHPYLEKISLV